MKKLTVFVLLVLVLSQFGRSGAESNRISVTSQDGYTTVESDYFNVFVIRDGSEKVIEQAGIIAITFMNNRVALLNRADYGILILDTKTFKTFWLGYSYPDSFCSPCNIGGAG